jgi:hypothetical protein
MLLANSHRIQFGCSPLTAAPIRDTCPRQPIPGSCPRQRGCLRYRSAGCLDRLAPGTQPPTASPGARPGLSHIMRLPLRLELAQTGILLRCVPLPFCHAPPPHGGLPPAARRGCPALAPHRAFGTCVLSAVPAAPQLAPRRCAPFTKPTPLLTEHRRTPRCGCLAQPLHVACRAQREQAPPFFASTRVFRLGGAGQPRIYRYKS